MRHLTFRSAKTQKFKQVLKQWGFSGRQLHRIRHHGGSIWVQDEKEWHDGTKLDVLPKNAQVTITLPTEHFEHELVASFVPIAVLYEDDDYLVVNKPAHVVSVPSPLYPYDDMLRRVWGYFLLRGYRGQIPHLITRLDRDTSGCMLFAKHALAHSMADRTRSYFTKKYLALLTGQLSSELASDFFVHLPIARKTGSIIERIIATGGKHSCSHFTRSHIAASGTWYQVQLLTGRTHQIRVHARAINHPLVGDRLYGRPSHQVDHQVLHAAFLEFEQPITHQKVTVQAPLPQELKHLW